MAIAIARALYQCARYGSQDDYIVRVVFFVHDVCPSALQEMPDIHDPIPPDGEWMLALRLLRDQTFLENIRRVPRRPPWHEYIAVEFDFEAAAESAFTRRKVDQAYRRLRACVTAIAKAETISRT